MTSTSSSFIALITKIHFVQMQFPRNRSRLTQSVPQAPWPSEAQSQRKRHRPVKTTLGQWAQAPAILGKPWPPKRRQCSDRCLRTSHCRRSSKVSGLRGHPCKRMIMNINYTTKWKRQGSRSTSKIARCSIGSFRSLTKRFKSHWAKSILNRRCLSFWIASISKIKSSRSHLNKMNSFWMRFFKSRWCRSRISWVLNKRRISLAMSLKKWENRF
jgi:hypothetical protein